MNTTLLFRIFVVFCCSSLTFVHAQSDDATGLLGDNFSLETTLEIFKSSKSLEAFEEAINKEDNHVHNLDLNGDGEIDYITVNDYADGDVHAVALSAIIDADDIQDIAVIEIQKDGEESASLQIVGDEDLYGKDMIVEPYDVVGTNDGSGPEADMTFARVVVNVWLWPSVRYAYAPGYVVYRSPWRWSLYPRWWRPWRPVAWSVWRPFSIRYAPRYRVTPVRRVTRARVVYAPQRRVSRTVTVKHKTSIARARTHKVSTSRTTSVAARGKNGNAVVAKKSTTKVNKANGRKSVKSKTKVKASNGNKKVKATKKTKTKKTAKGKKKVTKTKKVKKKGGR